FSSRRRHTRFSRDWSSDVCSSDLGLAGIIIALSLVAVIYIGLVAIVQDDMKKLVAYSSVAHMGFVTLGFFVFNTTGMEGAIMQKIGRASCRERVMNAVLSGL